MSTFFFVGAFVVALPLVLRVGTGFFRPNLQTIYRDRAEDSTSLQSEEATGASRFLVADCLAAAALVVVMGREYNISRPYCLARLIFTREWAQISGFEDTVCDTRYICYCDTKQATISTSLCLQSQSRQARNANRAQRKKTTHILLI